MAIPLTINGVTFNYPQQFDLNWGPTLTNWSQAVTNGMLQKAGGAFTLTAEVDFGSSFGIKVKSLKSQETDIASTGILRLGNASSGIVWRNALNNADLALTVNASNQLTFNGVSIGATTSLTNGHILVGNVSNQPADVAMSGDIGITNAGVTSISSGVIVDADINASAAIALSKLATLTASRVPVLDGSGFLTASSITATTLSYLDATSSIQTQLNTLTTSLGNYLPLAGGTMSGAINMGSHKVTSVTAASNTGEAVSYRQGGEAINGSSANSGGSAGTIQQGTVSTPDLRTDAVTTKGYTTDSTAVGGTSGTGASTTITTTGKPVLILASISLQSNSSGSPNHFMLTSAQIKEDGVAIGVPTGVRTDWGSNTVTFSLYTQTTAFAYSTPSAGSHTYRVDWTVQAQGPTSTSYNTSQIVAIELKA